MCLTMQNYTEIAHWTRIKKMDVVRFHSCLQRMNVALQIDMLLFVQSKKKNTNMQKNKVYKSLT